MLKKIKVLICLVIACAVLSVNVLAAGVVKDVKGKENSNITVKYNGKVQTLKNSSGKAVYPVIINGVVYLPVDSVASMVGMKGTYDAKTLTVNITKADTTVPEKQNTGSAQKSGNAGTFEDPVAFGKSFTWSDKSTSKGFGYTSTVTMSIQSVKPITKDEIEKMGFKVTSNDKVSYVLVNLNLVGQNVKATDAPDGLYYSITTPEIWGSYATNKQYVIGGTDYGFDGSISRNLSDRYPSGKNKMASGATVSKIDYSGQVLLPIVKGETNYLVMSKSDYSIESDERKIYFKLN